MVNKYTKTLCDFNYCSQKGLAIEANTPKIIDKVVQLPSVSSFMFRRRFKTFSWVKWEQQDLLHSHINFFTPFICGVT